MTPEARQPFRHFLLNVDALDLRAARAAAAERDDPLDGVRVALDDGLDGPVVRVPHEAVDSVLLGEPAHRVSEEDALHAPVHDHASAHHRYWNSNGG